MNLLGFGAALKTQPIPFYGRIHAGEPALLAEHRHGFITMDRRFVPSESAFFMRVKGDSMIGRAILDGDYVMVNPAAKAKDGDIIAARIDDEGTVKTYRRRGETIVLEPANPAEREIQVTPSMDFAILGVMCGVFRPSHVDIPGAPLPS